MQEKLNGLAGQLEGELHTDLATRVLYATDASVYREVPLAVVVPRTEADLVKLVQFAGAQNIPIIPRAAGTSLAGQVVGNGIVIDIGQHFNKILEINTVERWVRVQPGVVRDELNIALKAHGLFFAPETSTANRAMIGGMVGNNSCGSNSVVYGSTRDHLLSAKAILSDGTAAEFHELSFDEFISKCGDDTLESRVYKQARTTLSDYRCQQHIRREFPKTGIHRRNTGYAIDVLLEADPFTVGGPKFNFGKLLAGSEGTLTLFTELKLNLEPIPEGESAVLCVHFNSVDEALRANIIALKHQPRVSELIDHYILDCTRENLEQAQNRFFVEGTPAAVLVVEYLAANRDALIFLAREVEAEMRAAGLGYHFPLLFGRDRDKVWALRKAGLGLLSNLPGDDKAVAVIEDTAVTVEDLPAYIADFNEILRRHNLYSVHYAHAGSGELHLRPILNLKTVKGQEMFREIAQEIASLVKSYGGSLSGEHGDGRLRGEFIRQMIGAENYELLRAIKSLWDPKNIFNPGKIIDTPKMDTSLRYEAGQHTAKFKTVFRFPGQNILQHAEQCNGSGDCRKGHLSGGTMCPSYMATRQEKDTTRARANILREMLTNSAKPNPFNYEEIKETMDLCLSCKGCKSECPSSVDMAKLKAEFLHQYYLSNGVPFRARLIANIGRINALFAFFPGVYNKLIGYPLTKNLINSLCGFSSKRSLPLLSKISLKRWWTKRVSPPFNPEVGTVYFFCDEFTNYNDADLGRKAILLLEGLGYRVKVPQHTESGRATISKGMLSKAKRYANENVQKLGLVVNESRPLVGVEPSAILTFRDEYPDLVDSSLAETARRLSNVTMTVEEFLAGEIKAGRIAADRFTEQPARILFHGHCQQKAWSAHRAALELLSFPRNFEVEMIPSGCCGMAGSFGYEKEHYDLSMQIGELVLFPEIRSAETKMIIAASGTSCRHQIMDGTRRRALHPIEIMYDALSRQG